MRHQDSDNPPVYTSPQQQNQFLARLLESSGRGSSVVSIDPFGNYQRAPAPSLPLPVGGEGVVVAGQPAPADRQPCAGASTSEAVSCLSFPLHEKVLERSPTLDVSMSAPVADGMALGQHGVQLFMVGAPGMVKNEGETGADAGIPLPHARMDPGESSLGFTDSSEAARRRVEARKERNRRAQRTFRQRQKTRMVALEGEVKCLSGKLINLRSSNVALQTNAALLQKVLQVREEQIGEVQRCQAAQDPVEGQGKQFQSTYPLISFGMELTMIKLDGQKIALTSDFIATLSVESAKIIWMTYGRELQYRMEKSAPLEESLRLTGELGCLLFLYSLADPSNLLKLMESVQHDVSTPIDPVQIIQEALTRMNLDEDQKRAIVQKWKSLMDMHNRQLEETMRCQEILSSGVPSIVTSFEISQTYLNHHEAIGKLHDQAVELHDAEMKYIYEIVTEVLRTDQAAQLIAGCFPLPPQYYIMGEVLAALFDACNSEAK